MAGEPKNETAARVAPSIPTWCAVRKNEWMADRGRVSCELQETYLKVSDETLQTKRAERAATMYKSEQDPDIYSTGAIIKRAKMEATNQLMSDRRREHQVKDNDVSDPTFDLAQIEIVTSIYISHPAGTKRRVRFLDVVPPC